MQAASLVPHQVEILHKTSRSSFGLRSQNLIVMDETSKVAVVTLETANELFSFCFT
jgi:hypothetical protein